MDAHTLKTMLESRNTKVKIWYDEYGKLHVVTTSYSDFFKEYSITFSGITLWFDRFKYEHIKDRLILISGLNVVAFVDGDLK